MKKMRRPSTAAIVISKGYQLMGYRTQTDFGRDCGFKQQMVSRDLLDLNKAPLGRVKKYIETANLSDDDVLMLMGRGGSRRG